MTSSDPNKAAHAIWELNQAKTFIESRGANHAQFNPIRKTAKGPTTLQFNDLLEYIASKLIADFDKNTDYAALNDGEAETEEATQAEWTPFLSQHYYSSAPLGGSGFPPRKNNSQPYGINFGNILLNLMRPSKCMTEKYTPALRANNITLDTILEAISINPIPKRIELDGSSGDGGPASPPSHDLEWHEQFHTLMYGIF